MIFTYEIKDLKCAWNKIKVQGNVITLFYRSTENPLLSVTNPSTCLDKSKYVYILQKDKEHSNISHTKEEHNECHRHFKQEKLVTIKCLMHLFNEFKFIGTTYYQQEDIYISSSTIKLCLEAFAAQVQKLDSSQKIISNDTAETKADKETTFTPGFLSKKSSSPLDHDLELLKNHIHSLLGNGFIKQYVTKHGDSLWTLNDKDETQRSITLKCPFEEAHAAWFKNKLSSMKEYIQFPTVNTSKGTRTTILVPSIEATVGAILKKSTGLDKT